MSDHMERFAPLGGTARLALDDGPEANAWNNRCRKLLDDFNAEYPGHSSVRLFSAPGRTEILGNHTDHQNGRVLCAAVNRDILAAAAPNGLGLIRLRSAGFETADCIELDNLEARPGEAGKSAALIRGIAAAFRARGLSLAGADIFTTSNVPRGSGLSSSAAFEVLVATVLEALFSPGSLTPLERARMGQWAENHYFGKPSGLMDQSASAAGGLLAIDFADPEAPVLQAVAFDLEAAGLDLVIVHTGGSHADLVAEYAAIPGEMRAVAACFGKRVLREVDEAEFAAAWPEVRRRAGDRALLRAIHFFAENARVAGLAARLSGEGRSEAGAPPGQDPETTGLDPDTTGQQPAMTGHFLDSVNASGSSSWMLLQNLYTNAFPSEQALCVGLARAARLLQGAGACRVHGGGFGGTFQVFVPKVLADAFCREMDALFGSGSAERLRIRPAGAIELERLAAADEAGPSVVVANGARP